MNKLRIFLILILYHTFLVNTYGQQDSSLLLKPEWVTTDDITTRELYAKKLRSITATRTLTDIEKLPYTVHIITSEDILRNGYVTLTDVLKDLPGIKVSPAGNALEGETYMIRGLHGNRYVEVMINDIPLKSAGMSGLPIGAQIPVRQADRIEVVYGSGGMLYGDGSSAAVINIILKETERPLFTQADLGFGRLGYNSLDLTFGGKLGKDKNIFRFTLYGSNTVQDTRNIFSDYDTLFNTGTYLLFDNDTTLYLNNFNYGASFSDINKPLVRSVPFESRSFGVSMFWRGLRFSYHRLSRQEHSALGLNPLAVSYTFAGDRISDRTTAYAISFDRKRKRRTTNYHISLLTYETEEGSSATNVANSLAQTYGQLQWENYPDTIRTTYSNDFMNNYLIQQRFIKASSYDGRLNINFKSPIFSSKWLLGLGTLVELNIGDDLARYNEFPNQDFFSEERRLYSNPYLSPLVNAYTQLEYQDKHIYINGGTSAYISAFTRQMLPRLGIQYTISPKISTFANFSKGIRTPTPQDNAESYLIGPQGYINVIQNYQSQYLLPELTFQYEGGVKLKTRLLQMNALYYFNYHTRALENGFLHRAFLSNDTLSMYLYGKYNDIGSSLINQGVQATIKVDTFKIDFAINKWNTKNTYWLNTLQFQYSKSSRKSASDADNQYVVLDKIPNYADFMAHWRTALITKKFEVNIAGYYQSSSIGSDALYARFYPYYQQQHPQSNVASGYFSWDFMSRIFLSKNFFGYFQVRNVFNKNFAGIDATGSPDDLRYNPQPRRVFRLGINYNMN